MYKYQIKLKMLNKIPKFKIYQTNKFITQMLFQTIVLIANRSTLFNLLTKFAITILWSAERKKEKEKGENGWLFPSHLCSF